MGDQDSYAEFAAWQADLKPPHLDRRPPHCTRMGEFHRLRERQGHARYQIVEQLAFPTVEARVIDFHAPIVKGVDDILVPPGLQLREVLLIVAPQF